MKWNLGKSSNCCCWGPFLVRYKAASVFSLPPQMSHDSFHLLLSAISVFSFPFCTVDGCVPPFPLYPFWRCRTSPSLLLKGAALDGSDLLLLCDSCFRNLCPVYFSLYGFSMADKCSEQEWVFDVWNKWAEITAAVSQGADWCWVPWRAAALWSSDSSSRLRQPYGHFVSFHSHPQLFLPPRWVGIGILLSRNAMKLHANLVSVGRRKENPPIKLHTERCRQHLSAFQSVKGCRFSQGNGSWEMPFPSIIRTLLKPGCETLDQPEASCYPLFSFSFYCSFSFWSFSFSYFSFPQTCVMRKYLVLVLRHWVAGVPSHRIRLPLYPSVILVSK